MLITVWIAQAVHYVIVVYINQSKKGKRIQIVTAELVRGIQLLWQTIDYVAEHWKPQYNLYLRSCLIFAISCHPSCQRSCLQYVPQLTILKELSAPTYSMVAFTVHMPVHKSTRELYTRNAFSNLYSYTSRTWYFWHYPRSIYTKSNSGPQTTANLQRTWNFFRSFNGIHTNIVLKSDFVLAPNERKLSTSPNVHYDCTFHLNSFFLDVRVLTTDLLTIVMEPINWICIIKTSLSQPDVDQFL